MLLSDRLVRFTRSKFTKGTSLRKLQRKLQKITKNGNHLQNNIVDAIASIGWMEHSMPWGISRSCDEFIEVANLFFTIEISVFPFLLPISARFCKLRGAAFDCIKLTEQTTCQAWSSKNVPSIVKQVNIPSVLRKPFIRR